MIGEWLKQSLRGLSAPGPTWFLDVLLEDVSRADSLDRRRLLWAEIARRFVQDVNRACRIAKVGDPAQETAEVLDEALRGIGSERPQDFSRVLVRIMTQRLGDKAVRGVRQSLYLRQFLSELPAHLVPYAEGVLDEEGDIEALAKRLGQSVETVKKGCIKAFQRLPNVVEKEFSEEEVSDRTDGVWTISMLKEPL